MDLIFVDVDEDDVVRFQTATALETGSPKTLVPPIRLPVFHCEYRVRVAANNLYPQRIGPARMAQRSQTHSLLLAADTVGHEATWGQNIQV